MRRATADRRRPARGRGYRRVAAALTLAAAVISQAAMPLARADPVARWQPLIDEASLRFGVPTRWIERVMRAESGGRLALGGRPLRSPAGAMGLMQIMPATWEAMRARLGLGNDPDAPRDNILAGTCFLRLLYARFGYPGLFAAYNAGPARYAAVLAGQKRLPAETIGYLATVAAGASNMAEPPVSQSPASLFALRRDALIPAAATAPDQPAALAWPTLFAIRKDER